MIELHCGMQNGWMMWGLIFVREILSITGITIKEAGDPGKGARFEILVPKGTWRIEGDGS